MKLLKNKTLQIPDLKFYKVDIKDITKQLYSKLNRCSYGSGGYLMEKLDNTIYRHRNDKTQDKNEYIVYCTYNGKFAGWGLRCNPELWYDGYKCTKEAIIMLYVYNKYRRNGIGTQIVKKLTHEKPIDDYRYYKDESNSDFFLSLKKQKNKIKNECNNTR